MQAKLDLDTNPIEKATLCLSEKKFAVIDNFLPLNLYRKLCFESRRQHLEGLTRPAKIGRLSSSRLNKKIRGDKIRWICKTDSPVAIHPVFDTFEELRLHLKQNLFLPLHDTEHHLAVYPPGGFYKRHLDCHRNLNNRVITFILYLNRRNWSHKNGGQLKVWFDEDETEQFLPIGNRLILFSSADFYHAVLPCTAERYSFTGWFRRQAAIF